MGLIARQAGAPIADGETPSGTETEAEFDTIFTEINGTLVNANVKTGADIMGTKLGANTVAAAKITGNAVTGAVTAAGAITTEEMVAAAVTQAYIDVDTGTETTTTSATNVDVPGVTAWTVTPGSTSNFIFLELLCHVADGTAGTLLEFTFSIDGTDITPAISRFELAEGSPKGWYCSWLTAAASASSQVIKPRYLRQAGSATSTFSVSHATNSKVFRGMIIPI